MEEIFKKHPVYTEYEGSNLGNIRTTNWFKKNITHNIKQSNTPKGYKIVKIREKPQLSHRFIYECFNGTISENYEIDHINGNPSDNRIENLRAVSHIANTNNPITIKRYKKAKNRTNKIRVGVYNIETGILTIYPSFRSAEEILKISRETIRRAVLENRNKSKVFLPELSGLCLFPCEVNDVFDTLSAVN